MKYAFLAAFFFLAGKEVSAQSGRDTRLQTYVKSKGYILLTDTAHLSAEIMPYYAKLTAYLSTQKMYRLKDTYIKNPMQIRHLFNNKNAEMELLFPVIDITGIKILMDNEATIPKAKDTIMNGMTVSTLGPTFIGDPTGREYSVTINKKTGMITSGRSQ